MRKTAAATALLVLTLAGVTHADDPGSSTSASTAQQLCRAERGTSDATRTAFAQKYGTNKNKKNAFGKCVSKQTSLQDGQADAVRSEAQTACRAEQGMTAESEAAFAQKYGTNKNKKNAFGKCVSQKAEDTVKQGDAAEVSAAKACSTERGTTDATRTAFAQKYGTNKNKNNAFGKCVSQKAKA